MKLHSKYLLGVALIAVTVHAQTAPQVASMSAKDLVDRAATLASEVEGHGKHIRHLQAVARKEKDVVRLTCVNDKLVQLKAQQNLFDDSVRLVNEAVAGNNVDAGRLAMIDVAKTANDITNLRADAEACVGVPELYKQESAVSVQSPDFPDDPTTSDPFETGVETPGYASPYD